MNLEAPEIDKKTIEKLSSKKVEERQQAEMQIAQLGSGAVEALLKTVNAEAQKYRKCRKWTNVFVYGFMSLIAFIALAGVARGYMTGNWKFFGEFGNMFSFFGVFGAAAAASQTHKNAAKKLAEFDDVRAVGPLIEARNLGDKDVRKVADEALLRLLPRLRASDALSLNEAQRLEINTTLKSLKGIDFQLACALLKALEQVGDEINLPAVQRLAEHDPGADAYKIKVRDAAIACLPYLEARVEQNLMAKTLLRASQFEASPDTLLRPASPLLEEAPQELLRPNMPASQPMIYAAQNAAEPQEEQTVRLQTRS